jgi:tRNA (guanine37-N1)-methyltransferase
MKIYVLTLFPEMFQGPFQYSIIGRAIENKIVDIELHDIRNYSEDKHRKVDDYPFGGGGGMILKPEPIFSAIESIKNKIRKQDGEDVVADTKVVLLSPQGTVFDQRKAMILSGYSSLIFLCGHYDGIDERVMDQLVDLEISIGDYVLSGGELPAMVVIDSIVRLLPGVLGNRKSIEDDSHYIEGFIQFPQYTRPSSFRDLDVPNVLLSGNHKEIEEWRIEQAIKRTITKRPDLIDDLKSDSGIDSLTDTEQT